MGWILNINKTGCAIALRLALGLVGQLVLAQAPSQPPAATQSAATQSAAAQPAAAQPEEAADLLPTAGKIAFETHIQPIFESHCRECHGPRQAKNDFRVDDRDAVLYLIAPGDLANSALWGEYLINTDPKSRMPPNQHGNPLSELELAAIRVWIEDGAEWPETIANASAVPSSAISSPEASSSVPISPTSLKSKNFAQKLLTFVGFFHPAIVHFPIGLLLISGLFTLLSFVKRESFEPAAFYCLCIGALSAVVASVAGWSFAEIRGYGDFWNTSWSEDAIARHRIMGIFVAALSLVITGLAFAARRGTGLKPRVLWLLGSMLLCGVVGLVGHQGGELTYGEDLVDRAYNSAFGKPKNSEGSALDSKESGNSSATSAKE